MENISRRHIVKASLWAFGALCCGVSRFAAAALESRNGVRTLQDGRLNWDEFVEKLEYEARIQHSPSWDQASYVQSVAAVLKELRLTDAKVQGALGAPRRHLRGMPDFDELLKTTDVQVSLVTFEPNELLPHHNHPGMTGVLTCATGNLHVASYDRVTHPQSTSSSDVLLKKVGSNVVAPGRVSTLTNVRRNIHSVKALTFTQVIDIFTPPYSEERTSQTVWYRVDPRPVNGQADVFMAHPYS